MQNFASWFDNEFTFRKYYQIEKIDDDTLAISAIEGSVFMTSVIAELLKKAVSLNKKMYFDSKNNVPIVFISEY